MFWRPIVNSVLTYTEASQMHWDELMEANAALDLHIEKSPKVPKMPKAARVKRK